MRHHIVWFIGTLLWVAMAVWPMASAEPTGGESEGGPPELRSGPEEGIPLTPVPCYATDGPMAGREFDAVAELGGGSLAILFIHELTRNTAPVIRGLDGIADAYSVLGFASFTVMLSGDRTAGEAQLKRVNGSLKLGNPIVLSTDGAEGPGNYALNRKCTLTLVLAKGGVVHRTVAFTDTGANDVPEIRGMVEELAGTVPEDGAELEKLIAARVPDDPGAVRRLAIDQAIEIHGLRRRVARLQAQQQKYRAEGMGRDRPRRPVRDRPRDVRDEVAVDGGDAPAGEGVEAGRVRRGKPPGDGELNTLLRSFIRKTNDGERTREIFAQIEARAAEGEELEGEAVEMFKLMLSFRDRYGSGLAQELAEGFLKEHAPGDAGGGG